jgi:hypothetical protein
MYLFLQCCLFCLLLGQALMQACIVPLQASLTPLTCIKH